MIKRSASFLACVSMAIVASSCGSESTNALGSTSSVPSARTTPATGTTGAATPSSSSLVSGFPLDRDLKALVEYQGLSVLVIASSPAYGEPQAFPLSPEVKDPKRFVVSTPVTVRLDEVLLDRDPKGASLAAGETTTVVFAGGEAGGLIVNAGQDLSPSQDDVLGSHQLLIGGQISNTEKFGTILDPSFVYSIDESGTVTSLLESAHTNSPEIFPKFSLEELRQKLRDSKSR